MRFIPVDTMTEVLAHALTPPTPASVHAHADMNEDIERNLDEAATRPEPPTRVEIIGSSNDGADVPEPQPVGYRA